MHPPLTGLIPAPFTPMNPDGSLRLEQVDALAAHYDRAGVTGAFVAGTTGEGQSLTVPERMALAERWVKVARPLGLVVIVQVGHNCQADACALASHAARIGADAFASLAPCFFKPATVEQLIDFCVPIAAEAPNLPFYFYDIPMMTGVQLRTAEFLARGKKKIANLRGLKFTNMDLVGLQECLQLDGGAFDVLFGHDEVLLAGLTLGARGAVGTTYNFAAPLYRRIIESFATGDLETARREQARSVEMIRLLSSFGFLPAAKAAMRFVGLECGPVRPPLRSLGEVEIVSLREQFARLDVLAPGERSTQARSASDGTA